MFSKPINLILVYLVTLVNLVIVALPLVVIALPFIDFNSAGLGSDEVYFKLKFSIFLLTFLISITMIIYLVLDYVFGFSMRYSMKGCKRFEKFKDYDFLSDLLTQIQYKFNQKNIKLYIKQTDKINAYAVSSLRSKVIVLTEGLINHYLVSCKDPKTTLNAIRSIMAHETSHLIHKDFLPCFLIIINQKITNFFARIIHVTLWFFAKVTHFIPLIGFVIYRSIMLIYKIFNFVISAFDKVVVYNVYEFIRRIISRSIEYRCDRQSAQAFGGDNMAFALSHLDSGGYISLFSTHPLTKSRIEKVKDIKISNNKIRPNLLDRISNNIALFLLLLISIYFGYLANIEEVIKYLLQDHQVIYQKLLNIKIFLLNLLR